MNLNLSVTVKKPKFKKLALYALILVLILIFLVYWTPNGILRIIYPKRYVFNCLTKTAAQIYSEYSYGKAENNELSLNIELGDSETKILNANIFNNSENTVFTCPQFLGDKIKGIKKDNELIKKYFNIKNTYNDIINVKSGEEKYFGGSGKKNAVYYTNEYTLSLNKKNTGNLIDSFITTYIDDENIKSHLIQISDKAVSDAIIKVNINKNNLVVGLSVTVGDLYMQLISKSPDVLINDVELFFREKNQYDNIILDIKASGDHKLKNGSYTDNMSVSLTSSYLQLLKFNVDTDISNNSIISKLDGKAFMLPVTLNLDGELKETLFDSKINLIIGYSDDNILNKSLSLKYYFTDGACDNSTFDNAFNISGEEKNKVMSFLYNLYKQYFTKAGN